MQLVSLSAMLQPVMLCRPFSDTIRHDRLAAVEHQLRLLHGQNTSGNQQKGLEKKSNADERGKFKKTFGDFQNSALKGME